MSSHSGMLVALVLLYVLVIGSTTTTSNDKLLLELEKLKDDVEKIKQNNCEDVVSALRLAITEDVKAEFREKRILMHSESDLVNEVVKLRSEVALLRQGRGTVYVRWGKTECPQNNGTVMIYKGYMGGKKYSHSGDGTNHLCLPDDPTWGNYNNGGQSNRAYIYGTEFQESDNAFFGKNIYDQDVPCAVCKVPGISIMIPARVDCYPGWKMEYTGYLMANSYDYGASEYACIDAVPDLVVGGAANTNGNLLYLVEGVCGTLECPPYYDGRELSCVVCST